MQMADQRDESIAAHYGIGGLAEKILSALRSSGIDPAAVKPADLAPVDEFHMGGRAATAYVGGLMGLSADAHLLDVGSGLGGVARHLASEYGCRVTGIDLTPEYVQVARMLSELTHLSGRTEFHVGNALAMPWPNSHFDAAVTFHVAMNIVDRPQLYAEVARVLRPGAVFGIYDVLKGPAEGMLFPVPWAETAATSHLVTAAQMRVLLEQAGFEIAYEEDRREVALEHHRTILQRVKASGGPPPLGLHLLHGERAGIRARNMVQMLQARQIALEVIIARRRA
jgi:ubiquinone/menaquinone biosynthesis C-methylase UbiE